MMQAAQLAMIGYLLGSHAIQHDNHERKIGDVQLLQAATRDASIPYVCSAPNDDSPTTRFSVSWWNKCHVSSRVSIRHGGSYDNAEAIEKVGPTLDLQAVAVLDGAIHLYNLDETSEAAVRLSQGRINAKAIRSAGVTKDIELIVHPEPLPPGGCSYAAEFSSSRLYFMRPWHGWRNMWHLLSDVLMVLHHLHTTPSFDPPVAPSSRIKPKLLVFKVPKNPIAFAYVSLFGGNQAAFQLDDRPLVELDALALMYGGTAAKKRRAPRDPVCVASLHYGSPGRVGFMKFMKDSGRREEITRQESRGAFAYLAETVIPRACPIGSQVVDDLPKVKKVELGAHGSRIVPNAVYVRRPLPRSRRGENERDAVRKSGHRYYNPASEVVLLETFSEELWTAAKAVTSPGRTAPDFASLPQLLQPCCNFTRGGGVAAIAKACEICRRFIAADIVVGLHGAGLANAALMKRGGVVVELKGHYGRDSSLFAQIAEAREGSYLWVNTRISHALNANNGVRDGAIALGGQSLEEEHVRNITRCSYVLWRHGRNLMAGNATLKHSIEMEVHCVCGNALVNNGNSAKTAPMGLYGYVIAGGDGRLQTENICHQPGMQERPSQSSPTQVDVVRESTYSPPRTTTGAVINPLMEWQLPFVAGASSDARRLLQLDAARHRAVHSTSLRALIPCHSHSSARSPGRSVLCESLDSPDDTHGALARRLDLDAPTTFNATSAATLATTKSRAVLFYRHELECRGARKEKGSFHGREASRQRRTGCENIFGGSLGNNLGRYYIARSAAMAAGLDFMFLRHLQACPNEPYVWLPAVAISRSSATRRNHSGSSSAYNGGAFARAFRAGCMGGKTHHFVHLGRAWLPSAQQAGLEIYRATRAWGEKTGFLRAESLDDVVIHLRCGDTLAQAHSQYGMLPFAALARFVPLGRPATVGILSEPYRNFCGMNRKNSDEETLAEPRTGHSAALCSCPCAILVQSLLDALRHLRPRATVVLRDNELVMAAWYRLAHAPHASVCVASSFCLWPTLGAQHGYIVQGALFPHADELRGTISTLGVIKQPKLITYKALGGGDQRPKCGTTVPQMHAAIRKRLDFTRPADQEKDNEENVLVDGAQLPPRAGYW